MLSLLLLLLFSVITPATTSVLPTIKDYPINWGFDNAAVGAHHPLNYFSPFKQAVIVLDFLIFKALMSEFGAIVTLNTNDERWVYSHFSPGIYNDTGVTFLQSCTGIVVDSSQQFHFVTVDSLGGFHSFNMDTNQRAPVVKLPQIPSVAACILVGDAKDPSSASEMIVFVATGSKELSAYTVIAPTFAVAQGQTPPKISTASNILSVFPTLLNDPTDTHLHVALGVNCASHGTGTCQRIDVTINTLTFDVQALFEDSITSSTKNIEWGISIPTNPPTLFWFASDGSGFFMPALINSSSANHVTQVAAPGSWSNASTDISSMPVLAANNSVFFAVRDTQSYKVSVYQAYMPQALQFHWKLWSGQTFSISSAQARPSFIGYSSDSNGEHFHIATFPHRNYASDVEIIHIQTKQGNSPQKIYESPLGVSATPRDFVFGFARPNPISLPLDPQPQVSSLDQSMSNSIPNTWLVSGNCPPHFVHTNNQGQMFTASMGLTCNEHGYYRAGAAVSFSSNYLYLLSEQNPSGKQSITKWTLSNEIPQRVLTADLSILLLPNEPSTNLKHLAMNSDSSKLVTFDQISQNLFVFDQDISSCLAKRQITEWMPHGSKPGTVNSLFVHSVQHLGGNPDHIFFLYEIPSGVTLFGYTDFGFTSHTKASGAFTHSSSGQFLAFGDPSYDMVFVVDTVLGKIYPFHNDAQLTSAGTYSNTDVIGAQSFLLDDFHGVFYALGSHYGRGVAQISSLVPSSTFFVTTYSQDVGLGVLAPQSWDNAQGSLVVSSKYPIPVQSTTPSFLVGYLANAGANHRSLETLVAATPVGPEDGGETGPSNPNQPPKNPESLSSGAQFAIALAVILAIGVPTALFAHKRGYFDGIINSNSQSRGLTVADSSDSTSYGYNVDSVPSYGATGNTHTGDMVALQESQL